MGPTPVQGRHPDVAVGGLGQNPIEPDEPGYISRLVVRHEQEHLGIAIGVHEGRPVHQIAEAGHSGRLVRALP